MMAKYIEEEMEVLKKLDLDIINQIFKSIKTAYETGGRVYIIGNGGSSANGSHFTNDIKKSLKNTNNGFDVICLTDNVPLVTAYDNDVAYEDIFFAQLDGQMREEDILIALSVSGSSPNLVKAFQYAQGVCYKTIAIIGDYNGILEQYADILLVLQTKNYGIAEDVQQTIHHMVAQVLRDEQINCKGEILER